MTQQEQEHKPIDNVTVSRLDVGLRAIGIQIDRHLLDKIIDIVELIEDKGENTSLDDICKLEDEWNKTKGK